MYGCSYPMPVMLEIRERSGGLLDEIETEKKQQSNQDYKDAFVAASSSEDKMGHHFKQNILLY